MFKPWFDHQRESYESDTLQLDHLHLQRHMGVNNLPRVTTQQCAGRSRTCDLSIKSNAIPVRKTVPNTWSTVYTRHRICFFQLPSIVRVWIVMAVLVDDNLRRFLIVAAANLTRQQTTESCPPRPCPCRGEGLLAMDVQSTVTSVSQSARLSVFTLVLKILYSPVTKTNRISA